MGALLGEIASLVRDLLLRKTAPDGGRGLLAGGYEEKTLRALTQQFTAAELVQMMTLLQAAQADLYRSTSRRVDTELCLIRLCDRRLSDTPEGVLSRLSRLEAQAAQGFPAAGAVPPAPPVEPVAEKPAPQPAAEEEDEDEAPFVFDEAEDAPPWEVDPVPPPVPEPAPRPAPSPSVPAQPEGGPTWQGFLASLGNLPLMVASFLHKPESVTGTFEEHTLTLWTDSELTQSFLSRGGTPALLEQAAEAFTGQKRRVVFRWAGRTPSRSLQQGKERTILKTCWPWASSLGTLR